MKSIYQAYKRYNRITLVFNLIITLVILSRFYTEKISILILYAILISAIIRTVFEVIFQIFIKPRLIKKYEQQNKPIK